MTNWTGKPQKWSVGSRWLRWDPHLHAPGTLLNDQFKGDWPGYLKAIDEASPPPSALGITDYFTMGSYKEVLRWREKGAIPKVALLFANIELRLAIETKSGSGVNLHLLLDPSDEHHVSLMEEKLAKLEFPGKGGPFPCSDPGLMRLGRAHRGDPKLPDEAALEEGANQFKVEFSALKHLFDEDAWIRANVLCAVDASNAGLGGLATDSEASFHALREELGRFAQVIFSSKPSDRSYWLGDHKDFAAHGQSPKPCLHGSDPHKLEKVLNPDFERRCWIRAAPTFDGLRQTLLAPERRVHIGAEPPAGPSEGDVIRYIRFRNAPWMRTQILELNDGLVSVIGEKGSGKTALADLAALAAGAYEPDPKSTASFISKAGNLLDEAEVELEWGDGTLQVASVSSNPGDHEPRVRYLSQQFVERLCAPIPTGFAPPLTEEIERVVFSAITEEDRLQCATFAEFREETLRAPAARREAEREAIRSKTGVIAEASALNRTIPGINARLVEIGRSREALLKTLASIPSKGSSEADQAHRAAGERLQKLREAIAAEELRTKRITDLIAEIERQEGAAVTTLEGLKARYAGFLPTVAWERLRLRPDAGAISMLRDLEQASRARTTSLRMQGLPPATTASAAPAAESLDTLAAEYQRLTQALGLDKANAARRADLEKRLLGERQSEAAERTRLERAEAAANGIKAVQVERLAAYERVFDALAHEERALVEIYEPLRLRLSREQFQQVGKLLSFFVHRNVDLEAWATQGESLFDLRKGSFQNKGSIAQAARATLVAAWSTGTPASVREAMRVFTENHVAGALAGLAEGATLRDVGEWLFSTDHIAINYGIRYESTALERLSPGARGIVLLTLFLALDEVDRRPLIIDQPEENLDPRSVYADLVPFFISASKRRQIIMVTHNANLVVNTDSDQVIVASAARTSASGLPDVSYIAGGLEDAEIRGHVCSILEGGRDAFAKRGRRYGVDVA